MVFVLSEVYIKKIYFISGLPRSGNTLLSSILAQNPSIGATGQSCLPDIFYSINKVEKDSARFLSWGDHNSLNNIYKNIFNNYYSNWKQDYIIERSDWIIPNNYETLKTYCPNEIKIVILVRDILDIIKSFVNLGRQYPRFFLNQDAGLYFNIDFNLVNDHQRIETLMHKDGYVQTIWNSINRIVKHKFNNVLFIEYNDLVNDPSSTLKQIYSFYDIPHFEHSFVNLKQLDVNNVKYDDHVYGGPLHEIATDKISMIENPVMLPQEVIEKYSNLEVWRNE